MRNQSKCHMKRFFRSQLWALRCFYPLLFVLSASTISLKVDSLKAFGRHSHTVLFLLKTYAKKQSIARRLDDGSQAGSRSQTKTKKKRTYNNNGFIIILSGREVVCFTSQTTKSTSVDYQHVTSEKYTHKLFPYNHTKSRSFLNKHKAEHYSIQYHPSLKTFEELKIILKSQVQLSRQK